MWEGASHITMLCKYCGFVQLVLTEPLLNPCRRVGAEMSAPALGSSHTGRAGFPSQHPSIFPSAPLPHSFCQSTSCTFKAREVTRSRTRFLQMPRLIQTQMPIQRGPSTQCRDPAPPAQIYLDFRAPSPNSHRHSGLSPPGCSILGPPVPFRGANVSLSRRGHVTWLVNVQRGRLGETGRWNSRAPSQHHLTSLPELYQEPGGAHMSV